MKDVNDIIFLVNVMRNVIDVLEKMNYKYKIGIINNGRFISLDKPFENKQVIKIQWKKEAVDRLINKLKKNNIVLKLLANNNYYGRFQIDESDNELLVEYVVNSHVQLPHLLLKKFRTGDNLYILTPKDKTIKRKSARKYNTEFGYYSKWFEDYLSNNYESIISELISKIEPFAYRKVEEIELENLSEKINKLFFMSLFRNPDEVKEINDNSYTSILFDGGIKPEDIALTCEKIATDILKKYKPLVIINTLSENFVTIKCLFSGLSLKFGNSLFAPLHPKFGIVMVSNEYYSQVIKEYGNGTFIVVNTIEVLNIINQNVYHSALINDTDVIGIKEDLENLLEQVNNT